MQNLCCGCGACCTVIALCGLAAGPQAAAAPASLTVIDNCVSPGQLSFKAGVTGALLEERDAAEVAAAIVQRYPVIERDGLYPEAIALWRPPQGEWTYATLMRKAHAPHPPCFTANVHAVAVPATPTLIRKYIAPAP